MWATKISLFQNSFKCSSFSKAIKILPRSFSSLNSLSNQLSKTQNSFQTIKLFNRSNIKIDVPIRRSNVIKLQVDKTEVPRKRVGLWLIICSGMVSFAIFLGGYTRLTESGLSMVTWRFAYENFPKNNAQWQAEFDKYKEYPEFKQLKRDITFEEFKRIWLTEYIHRTWGRCIGIMFLIPAAGFWMRGYFLPKMKKRILIFGTLIALQGLMGWYMVKSGLEEERFQKPTEVPRVSQYRLAAHLGLALTLYTGLLYTTLDLIAPAKTLSVVTPALRKIKMLAHMSKGMVFLTALSGAFVAGLDAGLVYNSFPKMGDKWIPDDILAISPTFKNFTENPTTVQFDHRLLGITTFSTIMGLWAFARRHQLPGKARPLVNTLAFAACMQVVLGISTLVHHVPISQAVAHQSGSVVLLTIAVWLAHELKKMKYIPK